MTADCRQAVVVLLSALLSVLIGLSGAPVQADPSRYPVSIITADGTEFIYQLELAATPEDRSKGLMFRTELPQTGGMLFVWPDEKQRSFWMKNTPLSLDILFFSAEKKLATAHLSTTPFSEEYLASGGPVSYVVELNAGQAQANGLHTGSVLRLPDILVRRLALAKGWTAE